MNFQLQEFMRYHGLNIWPSVCRRRLPGCSTSKVTVVEAVRSEGCSMTCVRCGMCSSSSSSFFLSQWHRDLFANPVKGKFLLRMSFLQRSCGFSIARTEMDSCQRLASRSSLRGHNLSDGCCRMVLIQLIAAARIKSLLLDKTTRAQLDMSTGEWKVDL